MGLASESHCEQTLLWKGEVESKGKRNMFLVRVRCMSGSVKYLLPKAYVPSNTNMEVIYVTLGTLGYRKIRIKTET